MDDKKRKARRAAVRDYLSEYGPDSLMMNWKRREWLSGVALTRLTFGVLDESIPRRGQGIVRRWKKAPANRRYVLRKRVYSGANCTNFSWLEPKRPWGGTLRRWCYDGWGWFADRLNVWISELPVLWYDEDSDCVCETKPDEYWVDTDADPSDPDYNEASGGVWRGEDLSSWYELSRKELAGYLWGDTLIKNL